MDMRRLLLGWILAGGVSVGGCALVGGYDFSGYARGSGEDAGLSCRTEDDCPASGTVCALSTCVDGECRLIADDKVTTCERGGVCKGSECSGSVSWVVPVEGAAEALAVTVDATGAVLVAGRFRASLVIGKYGAESDSGSWDAFVAKLDAAGQPLWVSRFGGPGDDTASAIDVDSKGAVLVAGVVAGKMGLDAVEDMPAKGDQDAFVLALNPSSGAPGWSKRFGAPNHPITVPPKLRAAKAGGFVVAGSYTQDIDYGDGVHAGGVMPLGTNVFVARFAADGKLSFGGTYGGNAEQVLSAVDVGANGEILIAGRRGQDTLALLQNSCSAKPKDQPEPNDPGDAFYMVILSADTCDQASLLSAAGQGIGMDEAIGAAFSSTGDVLLAGNYEGAPPWFPNSSFPNGNGDVFLGRLKKGAAGPQGLWNAAFLAPGAGDRVHALAVGPGGEIVLGGAYQAPLTYTAALKDPVVLDHAANQGADAFMIRMGEDGSTPFWMLGAGGPGSEAIMGLAHGKDGSLVAAGTYTEAFEVIPGDASVPKLPAPQGGVASSFVMRFSP